MLRVYRAVPLFDLVVLRRDATISALTDLEALEKAKEALGDGVAFDLCEGNRVVLTHLPTRRWGPLMRGADIQN